MTTYDLTAFNTARPVTYGVLISHHYDSTPQCSTLSPSFGPLHFNKRIIHISLFSLANIQAFYGSTGIGYMHQGYTPQKASGRRLFNLTTVMGETTSIQLKFQLVALCVDYGEERLSEIPPDHALNGAGQHMFRFFCVASYLHEFGRRGRERT
jgi:hypothetical protein